LYFYQIATVYYGESSFRVYGYWLHSAIQDSTRLKKLTF